MVKRLQFCRSLLLISLLGLGHAPLLHAQDANNVLGLPAVPQRPAAAPTAGVSAAQKAATAKPSDAQIKSALSGKITAASSYQDGLLTVRVVTEKTFVEGAARAQALQAARLIQRDARIACGNLCKPAPMPAPAIQADNALSFDIVVQGYQGSMSTPDMINLISGKRVGAATLPTPVVADPAVALPAMSASAASQP